VIDTSAELPLGGEIDVLSASLRNVWSALPVHRSIVALLTAF
jgi:hypothetical protein